MHRSFLQSFEFRVSIRKSLNKPFALSRLPAHVRQVSINHCDPDDRSLGGLTMPYIRHLRWQ